MGLGKLKRLSRSSLFLFAISPFVISIAVHIAFLIYASFTPWRFYGGAGHNTESIVLDIKQEESRPTDRPECLNLQPELPEQIQERIPPKAEAVHQPAIPKFDPTPGGSAGTRSELDILKSMEGSESHRDWLRIDPSWGAGEGSSGGSGGGAPSLHMGPKGPVQSFGEYIRGLRQSGLDVVIVLDSTSSMDGVMREMKQKIGNLALALKKLVPACRIGLVAYRDKGDEYLTKKLPLTYGVSSLREFLRGIEAKAGGDVPEAVDEGLRVAVEEMQWNPKSKAFILIIGDAPPHDKDIPRAVAMAAEFRQRTGGIVSVLDVKGQTSKSEAEEAQEATRFVKDVDLESPDYQSNRQDANSALRSIAKAGGGEAGRLIDEEKVVRHTLLYVFGTQWRSYLTEVMKVL
ncbi:MAG: vWA domain-containing protein [Syntrophobacteraceae bacterium]